MEMSNRSGMVTRTEYARLRGVSFGSVRDAILSGRISCEGNLIDPEVADREWEENTSGRAANGNGKHGKARAPGTPGGGSGPAVTLNSVKTQHEQMRLELARIRLELERGNALDAEKVKSAQFELSRRLRDAIFRVAGQLAAPLAAEGSAGACRKMMLAAFSEALDGVRQ